MPKMANPIIIIVHDIIISQMLVTILEKNINIKEIDWRVALELDGFY
jgi:hypothetical protein